MNGKNKCKILKEIRKAIAKENEIDLVVSECKFTGQCSGTCPKCEAEVRYLENALEKRRMLGKKIALVGISASMVLSSGCGGDFFSDNTMGDMAYTESSTTSENVSTETSEESQALPYSEMIDGEIAPYSEESQFFDSTSISENSEGDEVFTMGEIPAPEESEGDEVFIMGDIPAPEESEGDEVLTMGEVPECD